jgi:hypothetical protein
VIEVLSRSQRTQSFALRGELQLLYFTYESCIRKRKKEKKKSLDLDLRLLFEIYVLLRYPSQVSVVKAYYPSNSDASNLYQL